jgi:PAS domain S-box-containing protein
MEEDKSPTAPSTDAATLDAQRVLEALQLREEQYRAIFEAASDGFVLRDAMLRTVDANPAFYRMYGFDKAVIAAGGGYPSAFPPAYVEERDAQIRRALAGETTHTETIAYRADGSTFWIDLRVMPVQYRGQPHVLQVVRDITDRRQAEAKREQLEVQLRQAQKMELIGRLTGGIAHDFSNILTSVIGYIVLATETAEPIADAKLNRQLGQAHLAAQRARDLIAQMLTFARRGSSTRKPLDLGALLEQSLSLLRATLPSSIEIEAELAQQVSPVAADAVQIEQVIFNLCINARDAMEGSGRLQVVLQEKDVQSECSACHEPITGTWLELSVRDSGSGIAPEVMPLMFDPFYTTKEVGRGSGLGLATVHGIVHDHGGHIVVDSRPKPDATHGSVFRILLPRVASTQDNKE